MIKQLEFNIFCSRVIKSIFHTTAFLLVMMFPSVPSQALDTTNTKTAGGSCDQSKNKAAKIWSKTIFFGMLNIQTRHMPSVGCRKI